MSGLSDAAEHLQDAYDLHTEYLQDIREGVDPQEGAAAMSAVTLMALSQVTESIAAGLGDQQTAHTVYEDRREFAESVGDLLTDTSDENPGDGSPSDASPDSPRAGTTITSPESDAGRDQPVQ
ncbi:hypothetical protein [Brevibacterium litoralis]|uniref:hypothetical protein n=1 Tax=Brevibacterium litoralis TaxID=3138935 RepID=UPI0032EFE08F